MSPGPLFSTPPPLGDPVTKRAFDRLIREASREGIPSFSYMVPLYDSGDPVVVVSEEESSAGPTEVTAGLGVWQKTLTATLVLEPNVPYRIMGSASCDMHTTAGTSQETCAIRANDGTNTLHTLYGTSQSDGDYHAITVPFTLGVESTSSLAITMDAQHVATGGGTPTLERMRLIAVATPVYLEGSAT